MARQLTSREAYHRVVHDARLDPEAFVIGYVDRLAPAGIAELPLPAWSDGGEIPWHRVTLIRCGGEVVWSRQPAADRFTSGELPAAAWKPGQEPSVTP